MRRLTRVSPVYADNLGRNFASAPGETRARPIHLVLNALSFSDAVWTGLWDPFAVDGIRFQGLKPSLKMNACSSIVHASLIFSRYKPTPHDSNLLPSSRLQSEFKIARAGSIKHSPDPAAVRR
jgi:hypothetical protein